VLSEATPQRPSAVILMRGTLLALGILLVAWLTSMAFAAATVGDLVAQADRLVEADESVQSLQQAIELYQEALRQEPNRADLHVKVAYAALWVGDGTTGGDALRWFQLGEQEAERALALNEANADAHFLLAANRGQVANRKLASPSIVADLEQHLLRAVQLNPRHAFALHMMAILLRDTPFFLRGYLKGSRNDVERYLVTAIEADPNLARARLDLAEYYRSAGQIAKARAQAQAVIEMTNPTQKRRWRETDRPAAEALLKKLPAS